MRDAVDARQADSRPWYLLTGVLLGLVLGLALAMFIVPPRYREAQPAGLTAEAKAEYRLMISRAYAADPNLTRAAARLQLLGDEDIYTALAAQAQVEVASGGPQAEANARALAVLAGAIQNAPVQP